MTTALLKNADGKFFAARFDFWLTFDKDGPMKMTRGKPACGRDERTMFMQVSLPLSLWSTPELKAQVLVGEHGEPMSIDVKAASEALKAVLGVDVEVKVVAAAEAP